MSHKWSTVVMNNILYSLSRFFYFSSEEHNWTRIFFNLTHNHWPSMLKRYKWSYIDRHINRMVDRWYIYWVIDRNCFCLLLEEGNKVYIYTYYMYIHTTNIEQTFFVVSTFSIQHCISSLKLESTKLYIFALFFPPIQIFNTQTHRKKGRFPVI